MDIKLLSSIRLNFSALLFFLSFCISFLFLFLLFWSFANRSHFVAAVTKGKGRERERRFYLHYHFKLSIQQMQPLPFCCPLYFFFFPFSLQLGHENSNRKKMETFPGIKFLSLLERIRKVIQIQDCDSEPERGRGEKLNGKLLRNPSCFLLSLSPLARKMKFWLTLV